MLESAAKAQKTWARA